jgi:adenosylcobinamide-GDP ribazoletransferase
MEQAEAILGRYLAALQFFIRLPLPGFLASRADHETGLGRAVPLFGLIGLTIGLFTALVWVIAVSLFPPTIAAGLAVVAGIWLTGGLHEDGFADCADGLGGNRSGDDALQIMRDSRVGAYGAIALIFTIGLRWAALATLSATTGALALLVAHSLARAATALPLRFSTYVRPKGTGSLVADGISTNELYVTIGIGLAISLILGGFSGLVAGLAGLLAATIALLGFERRIGGYTGDALGGMEQTAEIVVMIVLAAMWTQ